MLKVTSIDIIFFTGTTIQQAAEDALLLAKYHQCSVNFSFNRVDICANHFDSVEIIIKYYHNERKANEIDEVIKGVIH